MHSALKYFWIILMFQNLRRTQYFTFFQNFWSCHAVELRSSRFDFFKWKSETIEQESSKIECPRRTSMSCGVEEKVKGLRVQGYRVSGYWKIVWREQERRHFSVQFHQIFNFTRNSFAWRISATERNNLYSLKN